MYESRVGSKNELFPPKEVRSKLGLKPRMKVIYRIEEGLLIVEPVPSLEEVLKEAPALEVSIEELHKLGKSCLRRLKHETSTRHHLSTPSHWNLR